MLKRRAPTTLYGRSLLIIVLPIAVMQILVTWFFFDAHWQTVTSRLSEGLAGDIAWAVESYDEDPSPEGFAKLARGSVDPSGRAVDVQVTRLRRKIEDDPKAPRYLQTVRGVGYRLAPD